MSGQRARSAVAADHRSAHPNIPGVPWWGAVLIAATFVAIGFAFDAGSGNRELSAVFGACYVVGCLVAVLAVRQAGIFTAVIQPPLILFASVPTAYYLFTSGQSNDLKDMLINCGYPLIERFPLMFFTSAVVLLIGMARWYFGMSSRRGTPQAAASQDARSSGGGLASKLSALLARHDNEDEEAAEPAPRRRTQDRPSRQPRTPSEAANRNGRPSGRSAASRSRHARPPETEYIPPVADRPRRSRRQEPPPVPPGEPRRRPRTSSTSRRATPPPDRRTGYERPELRPEMRPERGERRRRYDDYEPLEPHGTNGNGTHHPISRVRYRGAEDGADSYEDYRPRRRTPRDL